MAGPLKNTRHEKYAQARAKGKSVDDSYIAAGFSANRGNAARLNANESVRDRVRELQTRVAEKVIVTAADIAAQLDEDRTFARKLKQASAAVSASMGKAKVLGLIAERHEHTGKNGGPIQYHDLSDDEIDARIAAHETSDVSQPTPH